MLFSFQGPVAHPQMMREYARILPNFPAEMVQDYRAEILFQRDRQARGDEHQRAQESRALEFEGLDARERHLREMRRIESVDNRHRSDGFTVRFAVSVGALVLVAALLVVAYLFVAAQAPTAGAAIAAIVSVVGTIIGAALTVRKKRAEIERAREEGEPGGTGVRVAPGDDQERDEDDRGSTESSRRRRR